MFFINPLLSAKIQIKINTAQKYMYSLNNCPYVRTPHRNFHSPNVHSQIPHVSACGVALRQRLPQSKNIPREYLGSTYRVRGERGGGGPYVAPCGVVRRHGGRCHRAIFCHGYLSSCLPVRRDMFRAHFSGAWGYEWGENGGMADRGGGFAGCSGWVVQNFFTGQHTDNQRCRK